MSENDVDQTPQPIAEPQPEQVEESSTLFFTPRRLGATAPHDCSIWSVDYRDVGGPVPSESTAPENTRRLGDESLTEQLKTLMDAGLQVQI